MDLGSASWNAEGGTLSQRQTAAGCSVPADCLGVELPVALFDASSPLVPSDDDADMVRASPLARGGDFLLCLAGRQDKDLIPQGQRAGLPAVGFALAVGRPRPRAGAAAFIALAGAVLLPGVPLPWRPGTRSVASSSLSWLVSFWR